MLCWNAVALAIASVVRRRNVAGASAGVLALTAFLLDYLGRLWQPAESLAELSPFRYFSPFDLIMGGRLPLKNVAVLLGITVVGFLAAYVLFSRRDISH
jgi:ABC-type transport system involved in multi-copper enzyme maturation permease subunit